MPQKMTHFFHKIYPNFLYIIQIVNSHRNKILNYDDQFYPFDNLSGISVTMQEAKEEFNYILKYSPYDNIDYLSYPSILVTSGLWDSQVQYYEPSKYVAKLREYNRSFNPILMKVNLSAGHGGVSGRFESLKEIAMEYAFLLRIDKEK